MILALLVASAAGIALNIVAFTANASILWVVLKNKTLRKAPTSVFLMNMCASDLGIAIFLIPVAITVLISASFEDNGILVPTYVCGPLSFIHSLLVYSGTWAAAAISVDRRFSIVAPMAHAAFMTSRRALFAVLMVWATAAIFALLPHLFPSNNSNNLFNYQKSTSSIATAMFISFISSSSSSSTSILTNSTVNAVNLTTLSATLSTNNSSSTYYLMSVNTSISTSSLFVNNECHMWKTCALMFALDWSDAGHVLAVAVGCYLIPTLIMISMYLSIFKVARKAGLQVQPTNPAPISSISREVEMRDEAEKRSLDEETNEQEANEEEIIEGNNLSTDEEDPPDINAVEIKPQSKGLREISLDIEANHNCIFDRIISHEKMEDVSRFEKLGDSTETLEPFKSDATCPNCSSKSLTLNWRSGSYKCFECGASDSPDSESKVLASSVVAGSKARRTLLIILGLSLASWTPYYLVHAYCACTNDCWRGLPSSKFNCPKHLSISDDGPSTGLGFNPTSCNITCTSGMFPVSFLLYRRSDIVSIVVWLLFLSSAINPILYGLLNRPVREQVVLRVSSTSDFCSYLFCRYFCRLCGGPGMPSGRDRGGEEADDGVEDFLQFLERTSSLSDTPTTRSSIPHNDKI